MAEVKAEVEIRHGSSRDTIAALQRECADLCARGGGVEAMRHALLSRATPPSALYTPPLHLLPAACRGQQVERRRVPVSYTHLTLPTKA